MSKFFLVLAIMLSSCSTCEIKLNHCYKYKRDYFDKMYQPRYKVVYIDSDIVKCNYLFLGLGLKRWFPSSEASTNSVTLFKEFFEETNCPI